MCAVVVVVPFVTSAKVSCFLYNMHVHMCMFAVDHVLYSHLPFRRIMIQHSVKCETHNNGFQIDSIYRNITELQILYAYPRFDSVYTMPFQITESIYFDLA